MITYQPGDRVTVPAHEDHNVWTVKSVHTVTLGPLAGPWVTLDIAPGCEWDLPAKYVVPAVLPLRLRHAPGTVIDAVARAATNAYATSDGRVLDDLARSLDEATYPKDQG